MRRRVLLFVGSLLVLAALPLGQTLRLVIACGVYLVVVLPAIDR